jgi:hypothetical protein
VEGYHRDQNHVKLMQLLPLPLLFGHSRQHYLGWFEQLSFSSPELPSIDTGEESLFRGA